MSKEKTAMQHAINKLDVVIQMWEDKSNEMDFEHTLKTFRTELVELLPTEREQKIEDFFAGVEYCDCERFEQDGIDYFTETYENND